MKKATINGFLLGVSQKLGFNITKQGNIFVQCFEHFLGYHIFIENLDRPLKVKIFFLKDVWFMVFVRSVLAMRKECTKN